MVTSVSRFPTKRLSVKKHHYPWGARIRFHGYARDRCKTDQGPLPRCEPTGLELVGIRWLTNIPCTRVSGLFALVTQKILLRNESGIAHIPASYVFPTDIESDRRRRSSSRFDTCRSRFIHTFSLFAKGENMLCYISEQGTLPGILMADLNVKHRAGSLCTVIFGRPLKFPPVVANRFQSGGVCLFSSRKFSPDGQW